MSLKQFNLNDDPGGYYGPEDFDWIVTDYTRGDYEGNGVAVGKVQGRQKLRTTLIGHCSCYGPWDGGWNGGFCEWSEPMSFKAFLDAEDEVATGQLTQVVVDKVKELWTTAPRSKDSQTPASA